VPCLRIAAACGLAGFFLVLRAQVFTADALSHVAFTGAMAALAFGVDLRTIQATLESALETRGRAQEIVRGAEASAEAVRDRVRGAIEVGRPATYEDIRELRSELQAITRRLDSIESAVAKAGRSSPRAKPRSGSAKKRGA